MPKRPLRPCVHPGCGALLAHGQRCDKHPTPGSFADRARGTRHERGYGAAWDKLRLRILARDGALCQPCARRGVGTPGCNIVDHRINKERGGTDDEANLQTICAPCHAAKSQAEANGRVWDEAPPGMTTTSARPLVRVGWLTL
jgi:5-methylcytosine-specific restriction protein A